MQIKLASKELIISKKENETKNNINFFLDLKKPIIRHHEKFDIC